MDSYGNYAVTWASASSAYSYFNNVNVQIFDYDGEPISEELRVDNMYSAWLINDWFRGWIQDQSVDRYE